jgi:hypothetical protein
LCFSLMPETVPHRQGIPLMREGPITTRPRGRGGTEKVECSGPGQSSQGNSRENSRLAVADQGMAPPRPSMQPIAEPWQLGSRLAEGTPSGCPSSWGSQAHRDTCLRRGLARLLRPLASPPGLRRGAMTDTAPGAQLVLRHLVRREVRSGLRFAAMPTQLRGLVHAGLLSNLVLRRYPSPWGRATHSFLVVEGA